MPEMLASLIAFAVVATITPGGATALAAASGTHFGFKSSLPLLLGISLGLASVVGTVAAGLAALIRSAPVLELGLRVAGSAYLLFLAWNIGRLGAPVMKPDASAAPMRFLTGLLLLWLNPKAWAVAVAAAAAYSGLAASPLGLALLLSIVFGTAAVLSVSAWCAGGMWLARRLRTERQWRAVNIVLALLLAASIGPMWL